MDGPYISAMTYITKIFAGLCTALAFTAQAANAADDLVVVELFTTQGCSSCPPLDVFMEDVARMDNVLALSWSVSIWDYLGWKDTLSIPQSNTRHRWYNQVINGRNMVYTPQVFVDGEAPFRGNSRQQALLETIEKRRGDSSNMIDVAFSAQTPGQVDIKLSSPPPASSRMQIVYYDYEKTVQIGAGENRGRTITYSNIVRGTRPLDTANGKQIHMVDMTDAFAKNCDAFAILLQDSVSGKMLAAAHYDLKTARS